MEDVLKLTPEEDSKQNRGEYKEGQVVPTTETREGALILQGFKGLERPMELIDVEVSRETSGGE